MKYPIWAVNSVLLSAIAGVGSAVFFMHTDLPVWKRLRPAPVSMPEKKETEVVHTAIIYQNDLFNTYTFSKPEQAEHSYVIPPVPAAPSPISPRSIEEPKQQFVAPLDAELKGIIYVYENPLESVVMLQGSENKKTENYQIGDLVQDAQIIQILPRSVVLIRSNGQQETLYLHEDDAYRAMQGKSLEHSDVFIHHLGGNEYKIYVPLFIEAIPTLGHAITAFDMSTVYKKGKSIGLKIGAVEDESIAQQLGLEADDIVVKVADMPVATTDQRMQAFKHITSLQEGQSIIAVIQREGQELEYTYTVTYEAFDHVAKSENRDAQDKTFSLDKKRKKQEEILRKKYTLAPTVGDIRAKERENIQKMRKKEKRRQR